MITFECSDAFSTPGNVAGNNFLKIPFSIIVTWLHTHTQDKSSECVVYTITFVSLPKIAFLKVLFGKEYCHDAKPLVKLL
jgi:hypothetical protein